MYTNPLSGARTARPTPGLLPFLGILAVILGYSCPLLRETTFLDNQVSVRAPRLPSGMFGDRSEMVAPAVKREHIDANRSDWNSAAVSLGTGSILQFFRAGPADPFGVFVVRTIRDSTERPSSLARVSSRVSDSSCLSGARWRTPAFVIFGPRILRCFSPPSAPTNSRSASPISGANLRFRTSTSGASHRYLRSMG